MTQYTVPEFWKFVERPENRERRFELIDGVIVEKSGFTVNIGRLVSTIAGELYLFLQTYVGGESAISVDHYLPEDNYNTRCPRISFISSRKLDYFEHDGYVPFMPDLAIEVKSPNNTCKELRDKAEFYLKHGSRMVWNFLPEKEEAHVYTLSEKGIQVEIIKKSGMLSGGDVLPGFTLALAQVFKDKP